MLPAQRTGSIEPGRGPGGELHPAYTNKPDRDPRITGDEPWLPTQSRRHRVTIASSSTRVKLTRVCESAPLTGGTTMRESGGSVNSALMNGKSSIRPPNGAPSTHRK